MTPIPQIYWTILSERAGAASFECYTSHLFAASHAGAQGYHPMLLGYTRTDTARNKLVTKFLETSTSDNDLLVMLDGDHKYPADIVTRFASHKPELGVVGALAFRRSPPHDALWFVRGPNQSLMTPAPGFELGELYSCAVVSTSAIAIRRWVFTELTRKGYPAPFFRYEYPVGGTDPSEDMYFGYLCERAGIPHHVDTSLVIPHAYTAFVDAQTSEDYFNDHPSATEIVKVPE